MMQQPSHTETFHTMQLLMILELLIAAYKVLGNKHENSIHNMYTIYLIECQQHSFTVINSLNEMSSLG